MYLSADTSSISERINIYLSGAVVTNSVQCVSSYQIITSAGMTLPQSSKVILVSGTTPVCLVPDPSTGSINQITFISIYNNDTATVTVNVQFTSTVSDILLCKRNLLAGETLQWSRETGVGDI